MKKLTEIVLYEASKQNELDQYFKDVCEGFSKQKSKSLASQYMYDEEGSRLVAAINHTEEYYLWRCQKQLLETHSSAMLNAMKKRGQADNEKFNIIDLGAGDGSKTKIIIKKALEEKYNFSYIPIDISYDSNKSLENNFKDISAELQLYLITATFEDGVAWVKQNKKERNLFLFMGGTIGSWDEQELDNIVNFYSKNLKKGDVIGVAFDKIKDPYLIQRAYSNTNKLQNQLVLNSLQRMNKELGANFIIDNFYPHCYYDPDTHYIYSSLISKMDQQVTIRDKTFKIKEAEAFQTHRSRKWLISEADQLFEKGNFKRFSQFEDSKGYFCYLFFEKEE